MEGNLPSGGLMISQYQHIKVFLQKKLNDASDNQLQNMLKTMLAKTEKYVNKALACDTIILATVLNPSF
jgi:hypothetical protein